VTPFARRTRLLLILLLLLCVVASPARAERPPAPELLPEETLFFIRVANLSETYEKFQKTSLSRMFNDPELRPLIDQLYGEALNAFSEIEGQIGLSLDDILSIPQGEFYLALVDMNPLPPQLVLILDAGDAGSKLDDLIERGLQAVADRGDNFVEDNYREDKLISLSGGGRNQTVVFTRRESTLLVGTGENVVKQMLDAWDERDEDRTKLIENQKFVSVMKRCIGTKEERPQVTFFIDPIRFFRTVTRGNAGAAIAMQLLDPLGLNHLEAVGGSVILAAEEFDSIGHFHVLIKNPREAVLKMIALDKVDSTPEPWVNRDASGYMTLQWDTQQTFDELASIYDLISVEEGAFRELVRSRVSERIGFDLEQEILGNVTGRVSLFTRVERPIRVNSQVTGVTVHFKDKNAAETMVKKLVERFPQAFEAKSYGSNRYYAVKIGGQRRRQREPSDLLRVPTPAMCQIDNCIVITDSVKLIENCLITKNTADDSLAEDLEYGLVMSRLSRQPGGANPSMVSFSRPEEQFRMYYDIVTADSTKTRLDEAGQDNPFVQKLSKALGDNPLPPFSTLAKYLAPQGGVLTNEASGIHYIVFGLRRD
jgi:hypothetical protein